jgi:hypothetical protein
MTHEGLRYALWSDLETAFLGNRRYHYTTGKIAGPTDFKHARLFTRRTDATHTARTTGRGFRVVPVALAVTVYNPNGGEAN